MLPISCIVSTATKGMVQGTKHDSLNLLDWCI